MSTDQPVQGGEGSPLHRPLLPAGPAVWESPAQPLESWLLNPSPSLNREELERDLFLF